MVHTSDVEARVRRFTPTGLTPAQWGVVRAPVVSVVVAAEPVSLEQAKVFASRLCAFLAWLPTGDWDRQTAPDLARLLTSAQIGAFTSPDGMPGTAENSRAASRVALNQVARALSGAPGRGPRRRRTARAPVTARRFWPAVAGCGPFTVLAAAYAAGGNGLHATVWSGLAEELTWDLAVLDDHGDRSRSGTARPAVAGTLAAVQAGAAMLRDATAPVLGVGPANSTTHDNQSAPGTRRPSRAAALKAAKAAKAAKAGREQAQAAQAGTAVATGDSGVTGVAPVEPLPQALAGMLCGWCPQGVDAARWATVEASVVAAVTAYRPGSARVLANVRSVVAAFALWLYTEPARTVAGDLTAVEFLADGVVERYLAGPLAGAPDASRATVRSVLRRVIRGLDPGPAPELIAYQPVQPPYTPADCARFVLLARHQPTDTLRRSLSALVALGLGAGLGAEDQRQVAPCHVREVDLGDHGAALAIDVPGPRARTVIMRAEYEPLLREALALHAKAGRSDATPLGGVNACRKNTANRVAANAVTATGTGIDVNAARLRSTWLVACMSAPVPLGALLHASGLRSARTLTDLLAYCPAPDPAAVAAILRTLEPTNDGTGTDDTTTGGIETGDTADADADADADATVPGVAS